MVKIEPLSFCASMIDCNSVITEVKTTGKYKYMKYKTATGDKYQIVVDTTNGMVVQINIAY